jgi:hypothetical protein
VLSHTVEVDCSEPPVLAGLGAPDVSADASSGGRRLHYTVTAAAGGYDVEENGDWLATTAGSKVAEVIGDRVVRTVVDYLGRAGWLILAGTVEETDPTTSSVVLGPGRVVAARGGRLVDPGWPAIELDRVVVGEPLSAGASLEAILAWAVPSPLPRGAAVREAAAMLRAGIDVRERLEHHDRPDALPSRGIPRGRLP